MTDDKLRILRHELLFGVRRSIRYHSRRRQFFERLRLFTDWMGVAFGSATIFAVLSAMGSEWAVGAAAVVTTLSAIDLVVGTARMTRLHEDLYRRFIALEQKIISLPEKAFTEEELRKFTAERLGIEADEPPIKRVLDVICDNELSRALGYGEEHFARVLWYQRLFAQFFDIQGHRLSRPTPPPDTRDPA